MSVPSSSLLRSRSPSSASSNEISHFANDSINRIFRACSAIALDVTGRDGWRTFAAYVASLTSNSGRHPHLSRLWPAEASSFAFTAPPQTPLEHRPLRRVELASNSAVVGCFRVKNGHKQAPKT
ncbi:hypothetical protein ISCGN_026569 [Ixodes scapularis]